MWQMVRTTKIIETIPTEGSYLSLPRFFPLVPAEQRITYSDTYVRNQFRTRFAQTGMYAQSDESDGAAAAYFLLCWDSFKTANYDNYARLIEAEYEEYSLIYNYDKHVEGSETMHYGDDDHAFSEQRTYGHGETVTRTDGKYSEEVQTAPYDAPIKTTAKTTRGHDPDNHDTTSHTGTDTDTTIKADTVRTPDLHEFGNIGVQTTADILMKEIELRSTSLIVAYIDQFVREYLNTYYPTWNGEGEF